MTMGLRNSSTVAKNELTDIVSAIAEKLSPSFNTGTDRVLPAQTCTLLGNSFSSNYEDDDSPLSTSSPLESSSIDTSNGSNLVLVSENCSNNGCIISAARPRTTDPLQTELCTLASHKTSYLFLTRRNCETYSH